MAPIFSSSSNISELGEKELIARICRNFGPSVPPAPFGPGDDCAIIEKSSLKKNVCVTSDAVILGRHFLPDTPAELAARKLVNRNISDIASMGARPVSAVTSAIVSKGLSLEWLDAFCRGMSEAAQKYSISLVGGDIAAVDGDFFSMHMTLVGHTGGRCLLRSSAEIGDNVYVTGSLGLSFESGRHLTFEPRVEEGVWLAAQKCVNACTDLSDGLASDMRNIIPFGACVELDAGAIPRNSLGGGIATLEKALSDGEDYELLFTARPEDSSAFEAAYERMFGRPAHKIGSIKKASASIEENAVILVSGRTRKICGLTGFDHSDC